MAARASGGDGGVCGCCCAMLSLKYVEACVQGDDVCYAPERQGLHPHSNTCQARESTRRMSATNARMQDARRGSSQAASSGGVWVSTFSENHRKRFLYSTAWPRPRKILGKGERRARRALRGGVEVVDCRTAVVWLSGPGDIAPGSCLAWPSRGMPHPRALTGVVDVGR